MSAQPSLFEAAHEGRSRLLRAALFGMLVLACAYRVWMIFRYPPTDSLWSDPARHWFSGTHPLDTAPMSAIDPIFYQIYLGVLAKLTSSQPLLVAYWTALLSLTAPWLWYRFLRELLPDRDWALAGWVLLAALPSWSAIYTYFMQETLMLPLLGLALWATWRCRRKQDVGSFVGAVAIWLLAGLTRGICLPMGALAMCWLWCVQGGKLQRAAGSLALVVAIMAPLAGRSWYLLRLLSPYGNGQLVMLYQRSGAQRIEIEFSRRGGREYWAYEFISPAAHERPLEPFSDWQSSRVGTARFSVDLDAGARDWDAAFKSLPPWDASRAAWLTGDNLVRLFFGGSWPDSNFERPAERINYAARWLWAPLSAACLVLTLTAWRTQRERMLVSLMLTWFVVQGLVPLVPNEGRYRKPYEGLLISQCLLLASTFARRRSVPAGGAAAAPPIAANAMR